MNPKLHRFLTSRFMEHVSITLFFAAIGFMIWLCDYIGRNGQ